MPPTSSSTRARRYHRASRGRPHGTPVVALVSPPPPLPLDRLEARIEELAAAYASASPFPHAVLDDLLDPDQVAVLAAEHAAVPDSTWTNYLHVNERKRASTVPAAWGPALRALEQELQGDRFVGLLERLTGIEGLRSDPSLDGGGLHRSGRGGFLNVHTDFTAHHSDPTLHRRVNLLVYLHDEWDPAWGGALELWDADMGRCVTAIDPRPGRIVVFSTDDRSLHGHPDPMTCPEGVDRRSLALYYFTVDPAVKVRATRYRARPDDGWRRFAIRLDTVVLSLYDRAKRRLGLSDRLVSRAAGALGRRRGS